MVTIFFILTCHWIFDFVFQTDAQAKGKSESITFLLQHTATYSICWFNVLAYLMIYLSISEGVFLNLNIILSIFLFSLITFICHTITDYFTSKWNRKLWEKGDTHNFFVMIGFDQLLHYAQLFICAYYLTQQIDILFI